MTRGRSYAWPSRAARAGCRYRGPVDEHVVEKADAGDVDALAMTLARAFDDDPLTVWLFPHDEARRRKLPDFFRALVRAALALGEVYRVGDGRGVAMWNPPGTFPMGWRSELRVGLVTTRLVGPRLATCARGLASFARQHPKERHWYLQLLGTDPPWQGRGVGSVILAPVLERCDRDGERAYLETAKKGNLPFYERHGFTVTDEIEIHRGPTVWQMWRDPR